MLNRVLPLTALAFVLASMTVHADLVALVAQTSDSTAGHSNYDLAGYDFSSTSAISVTELGMYVSGTSLADSHFVGIYTESGVLLTSVDLAAGTTPDGSGYAYASLAQPAILAAGTYFIGADYNQGSADFMYAGNGTVTMAAGLAYDNAFIYYSPVSAFDPTNPTVGTYTFSEGSPRAAYFGPTFEFQSVPEPTSLLMMTIGVVGVVVAKRRIARTQ